MTKPNNEFNINNLPTLSEVILVEETLQNIKGIVISKSELKKILKCKISQKTLMSILDYLKTTNKIIIISKGIAWINGKKNLLKFLDKMLEKSELTEEDAIFFGRQINKKVAEKFREI